MFWSIYAVHGEQIAVEQLEQDLEFRRVVSASTQRPLKILYKPHDFESGPYSDCDPHSDPHSEHANGTVTAAPVSGSALSTEVRTSTMLC